MRSVPGREAVFSASQNKHGRPHARAFEFLQEHGLHSPLAGHKVHILRLRQGEGLHSSSRGVEVGQAVNRLALLKGRDGARQGVCQLDRKLFALNISRRDEVGRQRSGVLRLSRSGPLARAATPALKKLEGYFPLPKTTVEGLLFELIFLCSGLTRPSNPLDFLGGHKLAYSFGCDVTRSWNDEPRCTKQIPCWGPFCGELQSHSGSSGPNSDVKRNVSPLPQSCISSSSCIAKTATIELFSTPLGMCMALPPSR